MVIPGESSTDGLLELWTSLYSNSLYVHCSTDPNEQGLILLIQCTQELFKKHLEKCKADRKELESVREELERKRQELSAANSEVCRLKSKCANCPLLEKEIVKVKREAREAQNRMDSIAKILRISERLSQNDRNQTAYDLVSQYVGKGFQENVENSQTKKSASSPTKKDDDFGLPYNKPQKPKTNSMENREVLAPKLIDSPEKNSQEEKQATPQKGRVQFNMNSSAEDCSERLDETIKEYIKRNEAELNRLWGGEEKRKTPDQSVSTSVPPTWTLKESEGPIEINKASGKALKQTKLGFKNSQKRLDVSKLKGFNGGVVSQQMSSSSNDVEMDDEDIVFGSPRASSSGRSRSLNDDQSADTTNFKPLATSTQAVLRDKRLHCSKKQKLEDQFLFERGPVRKKEDGAKLEGWSCFECQEYYSSLGLPHEEIKKRMNSCSRHRDNHDPKLNETPSGFWNPLFPDTPELERMYPAVFRKKTGD